MNYIVCFITHIIVFSYIKVLTDFSMISCDVNGEGTYTNCSDKKPEEIKPKN
jgi:hypothetical protein